jgi:hypothetical protein
MAVKHAKTSLIPDGTDTSLVLPSDWNADHTGTNEHDHSGTATGGVLTAYATLGHNHAGTYLPVSGAGDIYTHNAAEFSGTAHNHSGIYLPVSGAGDIYTHNAAEFSGTAHNHAGVYLPVSGAGDIYTHNASEFSGTAHNHTGVYEPADATILKTGNANWIDLTDGGSTTLHTHGYEHGAFDNRAIWV